MIISLEILVMIPPRIVPFRHRAAGIRWSGWKWVEKEGQARRGGSPNPARKNPSGLAGAGISTRLNGPKVQHEVGRAGIQVAWHTQ